MKPWQWIFLVPISALASAGVVVMLMSGGDDETETENIDTPKIEQPAIVTHRVVEEPKKDVVPKDPEKSRSAQAAKRTRNTVLVEDEFSPEDRKVVDAMQKAMREDDLRGLEPFLKDALANTNAAVRMEAVDALRWFGDRALSELTPFLADNDDGVRTAAIETWTTGVSQMEPGKNKADTVLMGLRVVMDKEQLESLVMQVDDLEDGQKIEVLATAIEGGNKYSAEVAREHYKFWTNEDYTDRAAAQRWVDAQADGEDISSATP